MKNPENRDSNDNKYPSGTFIYAKANPGVKMVIDAYKQRIYYCSVAGQPEKKQLAFFERELMTPPEAK